MTTPAAAELYKAEHVYAHEQLNTAMFNPLAKTIHDLPAIFGFNNGGSAGWLSAILMAEDGTHLGGHVCSDEVYMPADLGILDGTRPDRHEIFRAHYPDGYRMEFVPYAELAGHASLNMALQKYEAANPDTDEDQYLAPNWD